MRTILFSLLLCLGTFTFNTANAQVSVNINIGAQPVWGPVGYDYVEYYYFPDVEMYYYVPTAQYIYLNGGKWVFVRSLPSRYKSFNVYTGYKVVINEPKAYLHFDKHKVAYVKYKGNKGQAIIKDSKDAKYYVVKGHPNHINKKSSPAPKATPSKNSGKSGVVKSSGPPAHKSAPAPKGGGSKSSAPVKSNKGGGKGKGH